MSEKIRVIYAGNYSKGEGYPRANVLIEGLSALSNFKEIRYLLWQEKEDKEKEIKKPLKKVLPFLKSIFFFFKNIEEFKNSQIVVVGFPGYVEIFLFKLLQILTGSTFKTFFDYFFSVYESLVFERKVIKEKSLIAKLLFFVDKTGLLIADRVLIDTEEHRDFICKMFNLKKEKFIVIPVGENEKYFSFLPYPEEKTPFTVLFFGTFLNLHGIDKIKDAVKLLENNKEVQFILIGKGKNDYIFKKEKFNNLQFVNEFIPPEELKKYIEKSHIILGIFGENERANIVIPCKIYDALASGRPVITGKTKSSLKLFNNKEFVILCKNTPDEIAKAIEKLYNLDNKSLKELGKKAYQFYKQNFSPEAIGKKFILEAELEIQR
ncbi:glycosyl transferase group 1 [Thermotomaculum hydrothermale]|uniref:Glycosyl transferase group 1 n=1 Tax=Thermotomaculum hydrothermale TaxID=981385 RepID=A0A7R6SXV9_9BACT|nr:glycosyltransferase [Thermotomaculum hydrothermale]BBB31960.1 glycosyl transferase group 1 [Thermotomaculum hydrothermale]